MNAAEEGSVREINSRCLCWWGLESRHAAVKRKATGESSRLYNVTDPGPEGRLTSGWGVRAIF